MYKNFNKNYINFTAKAFDSRYSSQIKKIFMPFFTSEDDDIYLSESNNIYTLFALLGISFTIETLSINDPDKDKSITVNAEIETTNIDIYPQIFKEFKSLDIVKSFNICIRNDDDYIIYKLDNSNSSEDIFWHEIPLQYGEVFFSEKRNPVYKIKDNYFMCEKTYCTLRDVLVNSKDISAIEIYQELDSPWSETAIEYKINIDLQYGIYKCEFTSIVYDGIYQTLIDYGRTSIEALSNLEYQIKKLKNECYKKGYISCRDS